MTEHIEFDDIETLGAGAFGAPGGRTFLIQARQRGQVLSVLLEKEQVRLLAKEVLQFLDRLDHDFPEPTGQPWGLDGSISEAVPLFRARVLGIGYDPKRSLVVIELREWPDDEVPAEAGSEAPEARVARIPASRALVRTMAQCGLESVEAGRPNCQLCELPMDPAGHWCPRSN